MMELGRNCDKGLKGVIDNMEVIEDNKGFTTRAGFFDMGDMTLPVITTTGSTIAISSEEWPYCLEDLYNKTGVMIFDSNGHYCRPSILYREYTEDEFILLI